MSDAACANWTDEAYAVQFRTSLVRRALYSCCR
jgi:hypothetical protein